MNTSYRMLEADLDGRKIHYNSGTKFLLQVGRNKSSYKTWLTFVGNLKAATLHYQYLTLRPGDKVRLIMPSCKDNPVLARKFG
jgi:hypothetical protein